jgi:hypothetical protein
LYSIGNVVPVGIRNNHLSAMNARAEAPVMSSFDTAGIHDRHDELSYGRENSGAPQRLQASQS